MKLRPFLGIVFAFSAAVAPSLAQSPAQAEIISASTLLAFGRPAAAGELADTSHANKSLAELLKIHCEKLKNDPESQRLARLRAYADAFGTANELGHATKEAGHEIGVTYAEHLRRHFEGVATDSGKYRDTINRAYQLVIRRDAYPEEFEYWKPFGPLPYVVLVGAIENWALRNQPGLMVTTGTPSIAVNSRFLHTQRVSSALANEAREILGLPVWTDVARQHSPGRNIVAVGAKDIASVGGVHFLLAGGGTLWAP